MAPEPPKVFISYSHDSPEHAGRVLALAERLRKDGVDAQLDQYVAGTLAETWPRWMLNRLDWAEFVLVVCTETYYRRFRGYEELGKGADWEGNLITLELYEAKSKTTKFAPVFFASQDERFIPEPLRGRTVYLLNSEENYTKLYAFLTGQAGVVPSKLGPLKTRAHEPVKLLTFGRPGEETPPPGKLNGALDRPPGYVPQETDSDALGSSDFQAFSKGTLSRERWRKIALYGVISLISLLCGVVLLGLMIWNGDPLGRLGLTGNLQYLVLLTMGLAAAGFVFGVFRSYALYSGKKPGRMLEVIGSVVAFLLVVITISAIRPNEVKIGDKIFLRNKQGSYVITARMNWPRLGKEGRVILTLLGNGPLRHGSVVQIRSLEDNVPENYVLGAFPEKNIYYDLKRDNDASQEWRIVKLNTSDPVLHYKDEVYLVNVYYANKRLTQNPERGDYLTIDEEGYWWMFEKS